eukprot:scaffold148_cov78-Phaeocystis_antarctica.AAC.20
MPCSSCRCSVASKVGSTRAHDARGVRGKGGAHLQDAVCLERLAPLVLGRADGTAMGGLD